MREIKSKFHLFFTVTLYILQQDLYLTRSENRKPGKTPIEIVAHVTTKYVQSYWFQGVSH